MAAFMDLALYHPEVGYYARAGQRSGRAGDFFTSVDVGPVFGELLAVQVAEMFALLRSLPAISGTPAAGGREAVLDFVEAGAGNGRLSADIARAVKRQSTDAYATLRLHLVEASAAARAQQRDTLGDVADRLASSSDDLPESFEGVLLANELLDAMPVHAVVMREDGLRETYVQAAGGTSRLSAIECEPSTPRLQQYLQSAGARLETGWRAEVNLNAVDWIREAARRLRRGFVILIDYGHEAAELYSASHSAGTLTTFTAHRSEGGHSWLDRPGEQDITSHVDWTTVRAAAEGAGLDTLAFLDQTYFLLGLVQSIRNPQPAVGSPQSPVGSQQSAVGSQQSAVGSQQSAVGSPHSAIRNLKTLLLPGGLGSTMKVLILGKGVGKPALLGTSFKVRAT